MRHAGVDRVAGACASRGRFSNAVAETFETAVAPEMATLAFISPCAREFWYVTYVRDIRTGWYYAYGCMMCWGNLHNLPPMSAFAAASRSA